MRFDDRTVDVNWRGARSCVGKIYVVVLRWGGETAVLRYNTFCFWKGERGGCAGMYRIIDFSWGEEKGAGLGRGA